MDYLDAVKQRVLIKGIQDEIWDLKKKLQETAFANIWVKDRYFKLEEKMKDARDILMKMELLLKELQQLDPNNN